MDLNEFIDRAAAVISTLSVVGIALLVPLFLAQRGDLIRLREWREREPERPASSIAESESLLDRAELELERLLGTGAGEPGTGATPASGVTPPAPIPAATRVTHERPALTRVTMERAALVPHPRWRRFVARAMQPRVLVAVGLVALLGAVGAIVLSEELLSGGDESGARGGRIERSEVTVAVLNGTSIGGLAGLVGSEVDSNGYQLGSVTSTTPDFEKTIVLYADGQKAAAQKVAKDLGLDPKRVEEMDRESKLLADGADVVVIAGEDRAQL